MWVNPLLQALIDAAQSEQTSRTIRIVCTILVSLLYLIGLACLFLLVFVIENICKDLSLRVKLNKAIKLLCNAKIFF